MVVFRLSTAIQRSITCGCATHWKALNPEAGTEGAHPHYLIDTINELPAVIADIDRRLAAGEVPQAS